MPKKRGARKQVRKKGVTSTQIYVGVFIFALIFIALSIGNIPTAQVISGHVPVEIRNDMIDVYDGEGSDNYRSYTPEDYSARFCEESACRDRNSLTCVTNICVVINEGGTINDLSGPLVPVGGVGSASPANPPASRTVPLPKSSNGFFDEVRGDWESGTLNSRVAKYFAFFLLWILVSTILNTAGLPSGAFLRFLFSGVVAFLAVAYITPAEIFGLMQTYSAMGMALISIIPFVILIFFSASVFKKSGGANTAAAERTFAAVLLQRMVWGSFTLFLLYKLGMVLWGTFFFMEAVSGSGSSFFTLAILVITFLASALITFRNSAFLRMLFRMFRDTTFINTKMQSLQKAVKREAEMGKQLDMFEGGAGA